MKCAFEIIDAATDLWMLHHQCKTCQLCLTTKTTLWRRHGRYTILCNKCGIRCKKK